MRLEVGEVDTAGIQARAEEAARAAAWLVCENVLSDCREYVPYELGDLQASGQTAYEGGKGYVLWGTDSHTAAYARVQYYGAGLDHGTDANAAFAPKATHHWFEAARAERGDDWRGMCAQEYARRLRG